MTYVELNVGGEGPLCPYLSEPENAAHALHRRLVNAASEAAPRVDGDPDVVAEMTPDSEEVYDAIAYAAPFSDYMALYRHSVQYLIGRQFTTVETHWWRCRICGFVLPATSVTNPSLG